jgi:molybdopterin-guanine dinucleotide biosynthesis protein A
MNASIHIPAVLLAGGRSSRMGGGDKCLRELEGRSILAWTIERLRPQVSELVLNANGDPSRFEGFGLDVIADRADLGTGDFAGPLAGILAGMMWARVERPDAPAILTAATDTPFIPHDLADRLYAASGGVRLAVASSAEGIHPVFGVWPVMLAEALARDLAAGQRKVSQWVRDHRAVELAFPPAILPGGSVDPFFNINREEDLAAATALIR